MGIGRRHTSITSVQTPLEESRSVLTVNLIRGKLTSEKSRKGRIMIRVLETQGDSNARVFMVI